MFAFLASSCTISVKDDEQMTQNARGKNLTRSFLSTMQTTVNPLGSFAGNLVANLQIDQLEPGEYTIEFQVIEPPIDPENYALYAYIKWKVDGQQLQRIINVFSGAVISGVAEAVDVYLLDQSGRGTGSNFLPLSTTTNGNNIVVYGSPISLVQGQTIIFNTNPQQIYTAPLGVSNSVNVTLDRPYEGISDVNVNSYSLASYKVGATLSRGTRPTIMQPPTLTTKPTVAINHGAGPVNVSIPIDSGVISVLVTVIAGSGSQSESLNGSVDFTDVTTVIGGFVPNYFSGWLPIPIGAKNMNLFNNSTTANLLFAIQWGIEG
jgi:hypothetical protein